MSPLSHGARSWTKINYHWLSRVNDTAQFWLSSVNDTAEAWLSGAIDDLNIEYLGKVAIFLNITILGCESEAYEEMLDEKNKGSKITWVCRFK